VGSVRQDAASLYKFIDSVIQPCKSKSHFSYTPPSQDFFTYIVGLGDATKKHISGVLGRLDLALLNRDPADFERQARELVTLRFSWYTLHKFIRPALDAHTLESPYGLVDLLTQQLSNINGFNNTRFVLVHTSAVNYFQLESKAFQRLAHELSANIIGAPPFPADLAVVGIPYSQAEAVFLNSLIAHEMGHLSFQMKDVKTRFWALAVPIASQFRSRFTRNEDLIACLNLMMEWMEEIYCDLFAICLAGPAFSFAFIELLALSRKPISTVSSTSHPADALRLREQARLLQAPELGWWTEVNSSANPFFSVLSQALSLDDTKFSSAGSLSQNILDTASDCFLQLVDEPRRELMTMFAGSNLKVVDFDKWRQRIDVSLSHGVVPSRLIIDGEACAPSGLTILNAAYMFYLESLDSLLDKIVSADPNCLECRSEWLRRVEMWTAKALEDVTN
jgi:hypothetical protein